MGLFELLVLSLGLSMDAFAVAICKGLAFKEFSFRKSVAVGLWFGCFQALMPLIGYALGVQFKERIMAFDHWIAFFLLAFIGINMIRESRSRNSEESDGSLCFKDMLVLASATSIDALAVGVTFAFLDVNVFVAVLCIGMVTFLLSTFGVRIGNVFGARYKSKAEMAGGVILVLLGAKILLEHLGIF